MEQAEKTVGNTAQLFFYDWEANVLTPSGKVAATGLLSDDGPSLALSQGNDESIFPGDNSSTAGAMSFYTAMKLAAKQPIVADTGQQQGGGNQFLLFGAPGSAACAALAAANNTKATKGVECLIAGPIDLAAGKDSSSAAALKQLKAGLTAAETTGAKMIEIKQGTQVLEASPRELHQLAKVRVPRRRLLRDQGSRSVAWQGHLKP